MKIIRAGAADAGKLTSIALNSKRYWKYPEQWMTQWTQALTITPDYVFWNDVYSALIGTGRLIVLLVQHRQETPVNFVHFGRRDGAPAKIALTF